MKLYVTHTVPIESQTNAANIWALMTPFVKKVATISQMPAAGKSTSQMPKPNGSICHNPTISPGSSHVRISWTPKKNEPINIALNPSR